MQRLFLDTEFSGLHQAQPDLISIGLVAEDGAEFYAELPPENYQRQLAPWVKDNVLPLLQGGDCVLAPRDLQRQLIAWLIARGPAVVACDSLDYDFKFLCAALDGERWPEQLEHQPLLLTMNYLNDYDAFELAVEEAFTRGLRRHHALDDAKANRLGWIAAGGDIDRLLKLRR